MAKKNVIDIAPFIQKRRRYADREGAAPVVRRAPAVVPAAAPLTIEPEPEVRRRVARDPRTGEVIE